MNGILERIKRHGRLLAIAPLLTAITITLPKLYLEVVGTDVFGTREILKAEIVEKFRTEAGILSLETCDIKLRINGSIQREGFDCATWDQVKIGDIVDRVDAWTVFNGLDEVYGHAVIDASLAAIELAMIIFLLNIRSFIGWVEKQTKQSEPIFTGNSHKKEKI